MISSAANLQQWVISKNDMLMHAVMFYLLKLAVYLISNYHIIPNTLPLRLIFTISWIVIRLLAFRCWVCCSSGIYGTTAMSKNNLQSKSGQNL